MTDLATLRRWIDSGAAWRLRELDETTVTVELLSCERGTLMEVIRSDDPAFIAFVSGADPAPAHRPAARSTRRYPAGCWLSEPRLI
ncbi:MAG: hypothetical protein ACK5KO_00080 [Arachnia sp.]